MDIDLDMDNYSFDDILGLFGFSKKQNITNKDLKYAYKKTLLTHPDKSGLDKDYFLFFSKAYKMIYNVFYKDEKQEECARKQVYESWENEKVDAKTMKQYTSKEDFQEWFNTMFDQLQIDDTEVNEGYGDWLKKELEEHSEEVRNIQDVHNIIQKRQKETRSIMPFKSLDSNVYHDSVSTSSNLVRDEVVEYSSGIFSRLQFEDVKKAHTETVVPVTQDDFHNRKHFTNVDELNRYRAKHSDISSYDHEGQYKETKENEEIKNKERMFKMLKQKEKMEKVQDQWWKVVKTIQNE